MDKAEIAAIVLGVTEMVKKFGLPSKYCPAFAIGLGIIVAVGNAYHNGTGEVDYFNAIMQGLLVGVTTTGSYAAVDKFIEKSKDSNANFTQETH